MAYGIKASSCHPLNFEGFVLVLFTGTSIKLKQFLTKKEDSLCLTSKAGLIMRNLVLLIRFIILIFNLHLLFFVNGSQPAKNEKIHSLRIPEKKKFIVKKQAVGLKNFNYS